MAEHFYRNAPEYRAAERRRRQRERIFDAIVVALVIAAAITMFCLSGCLYTEADMALERDRQRRATEAFDLVSAQYAVCQDALEAARRAGPTGPQPGPVEPLAPSKGQPVGPIADQLDARTVAAHDVGR